MEGRICRRCMVLTSSSAICTVLDRAGNADLGHACSHGIVAADEGRASCRAGLLTVVVGELRRPTSSAQSSDNDQSVRAGGGPRAEF